MLRRRSCRSAQRLEADHDDAVSAQLDGRLDRAVEARRAVGVEAARLLRLVHFDRREHERHRGRGAHVLVRESHAHVGEVGAGRERIPRPTRVRRPGRLHERDRAAARELRRHHADGVDEAVGDVAVQAVPVEPAFEEAAQRPRVEQAAAPHAGQPQRVAGEARELQRQPGADQRRDDVLAAQAAPALQHQLRLRRRRQVRERAEQRRVDRADARPAQQRDALAARLQRRQQHRQRSDLVGAARPATRQHERHATADRARVHAVAHPVRSAPSSRSGTGGAANAARLRAEPAASMRLSVRRPHLAACAKSTRRSK